MNKKIFSTSAILALALTLFIQSVMFSSANAAAVESEEAKPPRAVFNGVTYQGIEYPASTVDAYLGVPFAQPPLDQLRWMPPQPLATADSKSLATQAAGEFADACMQGPHMAKWYQGVIESFGGDANTFPVPEVSEDCLYLNIWAPSPLKAAKTAKPLPVLVFIHGGSNKGGWAYEPNYIGESFAQGGAVVVTVAYRLGAFGFFSHPDVAQSNFALLDQMAALKWIKQNVAAVGGDPNNITVAGESAGANNIAYLLASPLAKDLFQRVIVQSGGWGMHGARNASVATDLGKQLERAVLHSIDGQTKQSAINAQSSITALRKAPAEAILQASYEVYKDHFFDPEIDGHSITRSLAEVAAVGELLPVDMLIGSNADEQLMYLAEQETLDSWLSKNTPNLDSDLIKSKLDTQQSPRQQLDQLSTGYNYVCPSLKLASAVAAMGGQARVYYFSKIRDGELATQMGAYHGAELPYMFNTHDDWLPTSTQDQQLSASMVAYWQQFMHNGNPNAKGLSVWPPYKQAGGQVQNLDVTLQSIPHPSAELCSVLMP